MEAHPRTGIMQTLTRPVLGESLFQRLDQFSAYVYRPVFAAGTSFWQLNDATFWGHNAIVRLRPFMRHCAMPELPEFGPLGTHILSHDTIEAALMRRGGFEVWQINDLEGSYEEGPPHLLASLQRDRRWCHGNLQHVWFLFERGLRAVSRFNIFIGVMAYANSPLWLLSLILGVLVAMQQEATSRPGTHGSGVTSGILYSCVLVLLFLPKILGAALIARSPGKLKLCGSRLRLAASVAAETIYSMLTAPILMLFYTRFVVATCCGIKVTWGTQVRSGENGPGWGAWLEVHAVNMILSAAAAWLLVRRIPGLLLWMSPVLLGPLLAIPFSRIMASRALGHRAKSRGWFTTPEEAAPPMEFEKLEQPFIRPPSVFFRAREYAGDYGLLQAVLDPYINAIHVSLLRQRKEAGLRTREYMALLADRLLVDGPFAVSPAEKRTLLWDADAMLSMHQKLWSSPPSHLHEWWQDAFRNYVESSALSTRRTASL
jgi:membrane glycosyltransferase